MSHDAAPSQELFEQTDFTSLENIVNTLFPAYVKTRFELRANKKQLNNTVQLEEVLLKTPFGDKILLNYTELNIEANKRQGLIGANSTGKSLLFTAISTHKIHKDFPKHLHVHHCKELEGAEELKDTVINTVVNSHPYRNILLRVEARLKELIEKADANKDKYVANMEYIKQELTTLRSADATTRAAAMLRVLGFDDFGQAKFVHELSGGLRMRVALCMAFFINADLLLLDEPTNHLDFPSVLWLENRLRGYGGAFLLVSHDRELLNNVCTSIALIEDQQLKYFNMGFKEFEKKKAADDKKYADEIDKFLAKNRNTDPSTMLGRQKQDKQQWLERYTQKQVALAGKFTFPVATPLDTQGLKGADGKDIPQELVPLIDLKQVRFSYNVDKGVFIFGDPIDFLVRHNTRCGVMGPNGAGKSTLLKLLTHKLKPTTGTVTHHPTFKLAYFGQHSTAELDLTKTPAEWMGDQFPEEKGGALRNHLAKTSIVGTTQDTRMERLSYSQRACIIFAKLTYVCPHLLILDEPTNFLDLESVDSLISACNKYKGALLLVSHNRDFLRKCATSYLSVVPGQFLLFEKMKEAESATYTFINDMESGGKVGKDALMNTPGGGSVHSSQRAAGAPAEEKKGDNAGVISAKPAAGAAKPAAGGAAKPAAGAAAAKPGAVAYVVGEKATALWKDGKYYAVVVNKVLPGDKYEVTYTQYGNKANVGVASMKKGK